MKYEHYFFTTLKDSNATGNTYFAKYFEWQGVVRELWCIEYLDQKLLSDYGVLITREAHNKYIKETLPFDKIKATLEVEKITKKMLHIIVNFYRENELVSSGFQRIFLVKDGKPVNFPDPFILNANKFVNNEVVK